MSGLDLAASGGYALGVADLVWLSGTDHLAFLERMSTNRLTDLAPGQGRATAVLSDIGRVVDLVNCYAGAEGAAVVSSGPGGAAAVSAHLRRYVLFRDRVRVTDASSQVQVFRLLGPHAIRVADSLGGPGAQPPGTWIEVEDKVDGSSLWVLKHPNLSGFGGVDLVIPQGSPAEILTRDLAHSGLVKLDAATHSNWRMAHLQPAFGAEIDGQSNPLELGLRPVVDFAKGCYIGQEVVARLDTYDKVQRHLVRLAAATALSAGEGLQPAGPASTAASRASGRVTTAAPRPGGGFWALAMVPAAWGVGQALLSAGGHSAVIEAVVAR